jgi:hypothetical protein
MGVIVVGGDADVQQDQLRINVDDDANLDEAQMKRLTAVLTTNAVLEAVASDAAGTELVLARALADAGFTDVEVVKAGGEIIVRVKSPPTN